MVLSEKIDSLIRFFLYVLIFWLPYSSAVVEICVIFSIILLVIKRVVLIKQEHLNFFEGFSPRASALNKPILFFIVACVLSVIQSVFWKQSIYNFFTKTLEWFVVFFLVLEAFQTKKQIFIALGIFVFTAFSTACDGLVQYYFTHKDLFLGKALQPDMRITAAFKTSNGLGGYLAVVLPLVIAMSLNRSWRMYQQILFAIFSVIIFWALILTFSRGAWLAAFVGVSVLAMVFFSLRHPKLVKWAVVLIVIIFGCSFGAMEAIDRSDTVQWRIGVWRDSLRMIADRPVFGHGINTFMAVFQSYRTAHLNEPTYAHNCYLQMTAEIGMLGMGALLWVLAVLFSSSFKKIRIFAAKDNELMLLSLGLFAGMAAYFVHCFFDTNLYTLQLSVYIWLVIGLLVATTNQLEKG